MRVEITSITFEQTTSIANRKSQTDIKTNLMNQSSSVQSIILILFIMLGYFSASALEALDHLKSAEAKLVAFAKKFGDRDPDSYEMTLKDTPIPFEVLPLKKLKKQDDNLHIHSLCVKGKVNDKRKTDTPLVLLHGYMNGALYFYRNVVGLSNYFNTVYSLDTMGCGLSSRSPGLLQSVDSSVEATEEFFVESIEAWRKANGINKMILAGHSMGGYVSVAYCEKYPQHVEQLVLLSPAGVNMEDEERTQGFRSRMSWSRRSFFSTFQYLFDYGVTPASFSRRLPSSRSRSMVESYIENRLPAISDPDEQQALTNYLYYNAMIPGCGEDALSRFLTNTAHARKPTVDRIPKLGVPKVTFLYGERDWMEIDGGIQVYDKCKNTNGPNIEVYQLQDAGHLLMLDNWQGFHAGVVAMCGGTSTLSPHFILPKRIRAAAV
jgi:cardiolipin-specific phospholipase